MTGEKNQKSWGIHFTDEKRERPMLLWRPWNHEAKASYPGEPNRPLLFRTREAAREWCRARHKEWGARQDFMSSYRVTPVRVAEKWKVG